MTQEQLKLLLRYEPDTGLFFWKASRGAGKINGVAGTIDSDKYRVIGVNGKYHKAHRLAWLYVYGIFPNDKIDHINGVRDDNRILNLRQASQKQNSENIKIYSNNKSGYRGVHFNKPTKSWKAYIRHNKKLKHLGLFKTAEEAALIAEAAREKLFTYDEKRDKS